MEDMYVTEGTAKCMHNFEISQLTYNYLYCSGCTKQSMENRKRCEVNKTQ